MPHPNDPTPTFEDASPPAGDGAPAEPEAAATAGNQSDSTRRPLQSILEDMRQPIRERHLETKRKGGDQLTYCPWHRVARYVEHHTNGHWSKDVEITTTERRIFVTCTVTIEAEGGSVSRSATGTEKLYKVDAETGEVTEIPYGDPSSNAESMAFRRACAQFGLGLGLYEG
ncbi:DUF1071 domain-containing protein [Salinibacter altiplanensis]|uniref:DUF1071 domain-containing protein n=1 Tax=Salinibacter altiplanensis TaxID=1803181 RepID=UPI000C9ECFA3|nr:DUF1071 domain-containing protein [Salinibacter altiplanensis]